MPERAVVAGYGGRTAIVGDPKNHATRDCSRGSQDRDRRLTVTRPRDRFLIVRLGALGDIVHAIPVAAALRRAFPAARIDWLVSAKHREILDLVPVIDRRLVVNDRGGASGGMSLLGGVRELRRRALRRRASICRG